MQSGKVLFVPRFPRPQADFPLLKSNTLAGFLLIAYYRVKARMFYQRASGSFTRVNCEVEANSDVSGIGVRGAFYAQAFFSILVLLFGIPPEAVLLSNFALQVSSMALIISAWLDNKIDVPHTIIASQFAVLLSACRVTSYDIPTGPHRLKVMAQIWLLDLVCRPPLLAFNILIWSAIRGLQRDRTQCPEGFGRWIFFSNLDLRQQSPYSTFALVYSWLDCAWEISRFVSEAIRAFWFPTDPGPETTASQLQPLQDDPRFWLLSKIFRYRHRNNPQMKWFFRLSMAHKIILMAFTITTVELSIQTNRLDTGENNWTFGQTFVLINAGAMLAAVISGYLSTHLWGRQVVWIRQNPLTFSSWATSVPCAGLVLSYFLLPWANAIHEREPDQPKWALLVGFLAIFWPLFTAIFTLFMVGCGLALLDLSGHPRVIPLARSFPSNYLRALTRPVRLAFQSDERPRADPHHEL
jgi:hypothetical protein